MRITASSVPAAKTGTQETTPTTKATAMMLPLRIPTYS